MKRCAAREYELFFDSCARRVLCRHRLPHPCLRCQIPSHALSPGMAGSRKIRPFASKTRRPAVGWRIVRVLCHQSGDSGRSPPVRTGQWWRWHAICHDCMPSVRICRCVRQSIGTGHCTGTCTLHRPNEQQIHITGFRVLSPCLLRAVVQGAEAQRSRRLCSRGRGCASSSGTRSTSLMWPSRTVRLVYNPPLVITVVLRC